MDFRLNTPTSSNRPEQVNVGGGVNSTEPVRKDNKHGKGKLAMPGWFSVLSGLALFGVVVLLLTAAFALARLNANAPDESKSVNTSEYQAVFLNNGQVYFGNISQLNSRFIDLRNIYYLTQNSGNTNTQTTSGDYTLVKLGCQQIHYPEDQMIISRDQVTFWENLNKSGKVAQSIEQFKKQNPNGPNCSQTTSQTPATGTPSQSATNPTSTGTTNKQ